MVKQQNWVDRITSHLIHNLAMEKDCGVLLVFCQASCCWSADRAIEGALSEVVRDTSEAIAA